MILRYINKLLLFIIKQRTFVANYENTIAFFLLYFSSITTFHEHLWTKSKYQ